MSTAGRQADSPAVTGSANRVVLTMIGSSAVVCWAKTVDAARVGIQASFLRRDFTIFLFPAGVPACRKSIDKEMQGRKAGCDNRHHTPVALPRFVPGRYPGSQVLTYRLPGSVPSGLVIRPHSLTVAGAAGDLQLSCRAPRSRFTCGSQPQTPVELCPAITSHPAAGRAGKNYRAGREAGSISTSLPVLGSRKTSPTRS